MDNVAYIQLPNDLLQLRLQLKNKMKYIQKQRKQRHPNIKIPPKSPIRPSSINSPSQRQNRPSSASPTRPSPRLSFNRTRRRKLYKNIARPQTARIRAKPNIVSMMNNRNNNNNKTFESNSDINVSNDNHSNRSYSSPKTSTNSPRRGVYLQNELSIKASMLTSNRKIKSGLLSKRTHEKLDKTSKIRKEKRINSIKSKTEYLMQQYLTNDTSKMGLQNSHGGYMETGNVKFSVQWIIEQTGLTPSEVDTLIEDEVESSVIMSNMKSKITSKIACCLCLNGLKKLGDDLPQYAKFLQTARRVLSSSIFEGDYEETHHHNLNRPDVMNNNYNDTERRNNNKISDKLMYKTANDILRDENDELRARIRQLESESQMNPQTLILEKMEQITEDQRKTLFTRFANNYSDEYASSLSSQTNQTALKKYHYASWYRLNNVSKKEVLLRALKSDRETIREVLLTEPHFLYRTMLVRNGELLHSFLWEHMDSLCNTILKSQELFNLFCNKKGKILCSKVLNLFSSDTKIFWEGNRNWEKILKFAKRVLLTDPYVALDAFKADAGLFADIFLENHFLFIDLVGAHPVLLQSLFSSEGTDVVNTCIYKFPEILDTVLNSSSFASAVAKRDDTEFIKMVLEVLSTKVLEYFQESKFYTFINLLSLLIK